jgi:hypothetical protein
MKTVQQIEKHIQVLEAERVTSLAANDKAIEAEEGKQSWDKKQQAANVAALQTKRDAISQAYDRILAKARGELDAARVNHAMLEARQNAEMVQRAERMKQEIYRAFIAAGGLPSEFDAHYQAVITARTIKNMEKDPLPIVRL